MQRFLVGFWHGVGNQQQKFERPDHLESRAADVHFSALMDDQYRSGQQGLFLGAGYLAPQWQVSSVLVGFHLGIAKFGDWSGLKPDAG